MSPIANGFLLGSGRRLNTYYQDQTRVTAENIVTIIDSVCKVLDRIAFTRNVGRSVSGYRRAWTTHQYEGNST